jgi:hypothetical protein
VPVNLDSESGRVWLLQAWQLLGVPASDDDELHPAWSDGFRHGTPDRNQAFNPHARVTGDAAHDSQLDMTRGDQVTARRPHTPDFPDFKIKPENRLLCEKNRYQLRKI